MKKASIKTHLSSYSIYHKRKTTINHAFASALAPVDSYNDMVIDEALLTLGQDPNQALVCVYCGVDAETWDHLVSLVKHGELRGFGHQIGNLVPCCKKCNSRKGSRDWEGYLEDVIVDDTERVRVKLCLTEYSTQFANQVDMEDLKGKLPEEYREYIEIKQRILDLMLEADVLASQLRRSIAHDRVDKKMRLV